MFMLQAENGSPAGPPTGGLSAVSRARATTTTASTTGRWRASHSVADDADGADALALALALARHDAVLHDVASSASTDAGTNAAAVAGASGRDV
ncbi:hypothetical protein E4U32_001621 [Claviceps aff. humidiphila group G2b]|nr:hypothetical protein E4U32_001621 [Claviceps aff. humidiphila group G2b]